MRWLVGLLVGWGMLLGMPVLALAVAPILYATRDYQSPVWAAPGELLLLAGANLPASATVVYVERTNTTSPLTAPTSVPSNSTSHTGTAAIVQTTTQPEALVVRLPSVMNARQSYALWVRNVGGEWSNGVQLGDARPQWFSPSRVFTTGLSPGFTTRELTVVGRNLAPASCASTLVRLTGPETVTLGATAPPSDAPHLASYEARVTLPDTLAVGTYSVAVARDRRSWVPLAGQSLTVLAAPAAPAIFPVGTYGGCVANDAGDDTVCIANALAAAGTAGGGVVTFGPGLWRMEDSVTGGYDQYPNQGLIVPVGVSLRGAGMELTTIRRGANWNSIGDTAWMANFVLLGSNTVSDITFEDMKTYDATSGGLQGILELGRRFWWVQSGDPNPVNDITITRNRFRKPFVAIFADAKPVVRLTITQNEVGAFNNGLYITGEPLTGKWTLQDFRLTNNIFRPGSFYDPGNAQGTIATQLFALRRTLIRDNWVDGTSTAYLQNPGSDPKGWRAGLFFTNPASVEHLLVARNTLTCTGDKVGDGEAIAYDGVDNPTFARAQAVLTATATSVKVGPGTLPTLNSHSQPVWDDWFDSDIWVQVVAGPGTGQMRRVTARATDGSGETFTTSPAWDVTPTTSSKLSIGNIYWQVATVDNVVDQRTPLCTKANVTRPAGGSIMHYGGPWSDVVLHGNEQYDTNGILLNTRSVAASAADDAAGYGGQFIQGFMAEVRGNVIDGEYAWGTDASQAGLQVWMHASATDGIAPEVTGYGVNLVGNTIRHSDGLRGGGITLALAGSAGPTPFNWHYLSDTLVQGNTLEMLSGPPPTTVVDEVHTTRIGIHLDSLLAWNSVLTHNVFVDVTTPLLDEASATLLDGPLP
jgi:hypothetical protein